MADRRRSNNEVPVSPRTPGQASPRLSPRISSAREPRRSFSSAPDSPRPTRGNRKATVFIDNPEQFLKDLKRKPGSGDKAAPRRVSDSPRPDGDATTPKSESGPRGKKAAEKENIKVAVRIRPKIGRDQKEADIVRLSDDGTTISFKEGSEASSVSGRRDKPGKTYTYDYVFDSRPEARKTTTQKNIFDCIGDRIVQGAIEGFNACLFAYGQTGTGKTHTVVGKPAERGIPIGEQEERGVLPRILEGIFCEVEKRRNDGRPVVVRISFLEIYNEMINDLLVPPSKKTGKETSLAIRYTPGLGLTITDLSEPVATTFEEAYQLVDFGMKMRSIAATSMNSRSSRAHTVFTFRMESEESDGGETKMAQVQIIDLAGRETEKTSGDDRERLRERSFINKSLFHLSTCISNLSRSGGKVQEFTFRNSKLTMVLTNSLGKNSRTSMIAAISPTQADIDETISTLRFAQQVKMIVNTASCNSLNKKDLVTELKSEIQRLRIEQGEQGIVVNKELQDQVSQLEELCKSYQENLAQETERAKQLHDRQKETLIDLGLSVAATSNSIHISQDQDVPYLVNLSEDPFLEGCLMYFLQPHEVTSVGSSRNENKIHLEGLGLAPRHCSIQNDDNETIVLSPVEPALDTSDSSADTGGVPRTFLNGQRVIGPTPIKHQDRLILGHAFAFKVHVPKFSRKRLQSNADGAKSAVPSDSVPADGTLSSSVDAFHLQDAGQGHQTLAEALAEVQEPNRVLVHHTCQRFTEHLGHDVSKTYVAEINRAVGLVEEANVISREVRPQEFLEFRLQLLTDVFSSPMPSEVPAMVVAVMTKIPSSSKPASPGEGMNEASEQTAVMKFVWSFDKFKNRLQWMRDFYAEFQAQGAESCMEKLSREPYSDPWKEIGAAEVQMLLEGLGSTGHETENGTTPTSAGSMSDGEDGSDEDESTPESTPEEDDLPSPAARRQNRAVTICSPTKRGSITGSTRRRSVDVGALMGSRSPRIKEEATWYDIGRQNRKQFFNHPQSDTATRKGMKSCPLSAFRPPTERTPLSESLDDVSLRNSLPRPKPPSRFEEDRIWESLGDFQTPLDAGNSCIKNISAELQVKEVERSAKLKDWFTQIQVKEDLLMQVQENLKQLRALDSPSSQQSSPVSPQNGTSPSRFGSLQRTSEPAVQTRDVSPITVTSPEGTNTVPSRQSKITRFDDEADGREASGYMTWSGPRPNPHDR